jgi:exosortase sorting signal-containing protein
VTGTNLSAFPCFPICNPAALLIGGIAVPFTSPNPNTILAVTPPHAPGVVDIVYFPPDYPDRFTGHVLPAAFTYEAEAEVPALSRTGLALLAAVLALMAISFLKRR